MRGMMADKETTPIDELRRRVEELQRVCAEAYQFAGAVGAPERVLDNLSAAAEGRPVPHESFLPVSADECDDVAALKTRLDEVRKLVGAA